MRKFSNKSKKEKKNAIRRKTKGNRRNNKRRTYRKKMKGGNETHPAAEEVTKLVNDLETNVNNVIEVINSIPGEEEKEEEEKEKAIIFFNSVEEIKNAYQKLNLALPIVKNSLKELSKKKGTCVYDITVKNILKNIREQKFKDPACEKSKKESYIKAVEAINKIPKLQETARKKLIVLNKIKSEQKQKNTAIELLNAIELLKAIILNVIQITTTSKEKDNIAAIKQKARSRGATGEELGDKTDPKLESDITDTYNNGEIKNNFRHQDPSVFVPNPLLDKNENGKNVENDENENDENVKNELLIANTFGHNPLNTRKTTSKRSLTPYANS